ncbi:MAG TPA: hypothetical protein VD761_06690 [Solirubrobacterales bacterium]|nr:hypothetical protein [Solirubrobacterales bacterium]
MRTTIISTRIALALTALALAVGISAPAASAIEFTQVGAALDDIDGNPERQAGSHPDVRVRFDVPQIDPDNVDSAPVEAPHRFLIDLPPGLIGNPGAAELCPATALKGANQGNGAACPIASQIGFARIGPRSEYPLPAPIYNVVPPKGSPAMFAFNALGVVVRLTPTLRPGEYAITIDSGGISTGIQIPGVETIFWGVPSDPVHDPQRYGPQLNGAFYWAPATTDYPRKSFMSAPTSCSAEPSSWTASLDGWKSIGSYTSSLFNADPDGDPFRFTGCDQVPFTPSIEARPTTNLADSPSGLDVKITTPQNTDPDGLSEAHLKDVVLTLPEGMTVNPASANGLAACSPAQIGLTSPVGQPKAMFDNAPATCPAASKLGTAQIDTPLIDHPLKGAVYLGEQGSNPFNSLLALYISIEDPVSGTMIKLAGHPVPDPQTGRLTINFMNNPQLPFQEFRVNMFSGPRAALKTPMACGQFAANAALTPWSSPAGATAQRTDSFAIERGAGGSACLKAEAEASSARTFRAGTVDPTAGIYSPFAMKITRADGTQPIGAIKTTLPKGLLGKLAGIPYCSEAALAAATGKTGKAEQQAASCPAASAVGNVTVGAGAGSEPHYAGGKAYLAGPYKGAPLSLAIITPAVAGPFDLGNVVVRAALQIDPESTQITAVSDAIPTILQGIPLDIRSIAVSIDRPAFTRNPTSCDPMSVLGSTTSVFNQETALASHFQVGGCERLAFKPKLALRLKGGTDRSDYPALTATLNARGGDANIGKASVALPRSVFLAQEHIRTVCTRVQWAADTCPKAAIYGKATAWSPLLDAPLTGNVYLRSSNNELPDLVADLRGQIRVALVGRIDSHRGGIRTTFDSVPDAPVSRFVLKMRGGQKSLLVNSRNLCGSVSRATVQLDGQNGKTHDTRPVLKSNCNKTKKPKSKRAGKR